MSVNTFYECEHFIYGLNEPAIASGSWKAQVISSVADSSAIPESGS